MIHAGSLQVILQIFGEQLPQLHTLTKPPSRDCLDHALLPRKLEDAARINHRLCLRDKAAPVDVLTSSGVIDTLRTRLRWQSTPNTTPFIYTALEGIEDVKTPTFQ